MRRHAFRLRLPYTLRLLTLAALHASALGAAPLVAQEGWNPFKDRDEQAARAKAKQVAPPPAGPVLPPMNGSTAGSESYGSTPYYGAQGATGYPSAASPGGTYAGPAPYSPQQGARADPPIGYRPASPPPAPQGAVAETPRFVPRDSGVEKGDLSPVMTRDGSGLPLDLWRGADIKSVEEIISGGDIPPRSSALHALWRRALVAEAPPPSGGDAAHFQALKLEALWRSGLISDMAEILKTGAGKENALIQIFEIRVKLALGEREAACERVKAANMISADLPKPLRAEAILLSGYCAALAGNAPAAQLTVDLAREEGIEAPLAMSVLDALAANTPAKPQWPKRVSLIDYRFLELAKVANMPQLANQAEPALVFALAHDRNGDPATRVIAAEKAAQMFVIEPGKLGEAYGAVAFQPLQMADPLSAKVDPSLRRAMLVQAAQREATPVRKARLMQALLDDARRTGLYVPIASLLGKDLERLPPSTELGWFAELGTEIALANRSYPLAHKWVMFGASLDRLGGGSNLQHWLALLDIADTTAGAPHGSGIRYVEDLALKGRLSTDLLHRLATVLDALEYNVPIPLWEAASRTPQPSTGHLPETGLLPQLQDAAKQKQYGRTVLLAIRALGSNGPEGAHIIALGDSIRALNKAGLEADARRLGFEALFMHWPRQPGQLGSAR